MASYSQQIVAVDTKMSQVVHSPQYRKTYIKRRLQLLDLEQRSRIPASNQFRPTNAGGSSSRVAVVPPCGCCARIDTAAGSVRPGIDYLRLRTLLLRRAARQLGHPDVLSTKSFSATTGEVRSGVSPARFVPGRPSHASASVEEVLAGLSLSEAYDFRGFHHVSDLHRAPVTQLMFAHNDNNKLIASSMDGSLSVYRLDMEPPQVELTLKAHTQGVTDFDLSTSNEFLVSCSLDGSLCLWRLSDGRLLRQLNCRQPINSCRVLPGNNNLVVAGTTGGLVQVVNISTGMFPASGTSTVPGAVLCLATHQQEALVWAGTDRGTVFSFRVDCLQARLAKGHRVSVGQEERQARVTCINARPFLSSNQSLLLVSCGNNSLLLYLVTDQLGSLSLFRKFSVVHGQLSVRSNFAPLMSGRTGNCVVSCSEDGCVYFFDVSKTERACVNKLQAHSCPALAVAFNYSETYLATSDSSGLVIVWKR